MTRIVVLSELGGVERVREAEVDGLEGSNFVAEMLGGVGTFVASLKESENVALYALALSDAQTDDGDVPANDMYIPGGREPIIRGPVLLVRIAYGFEVGVGIGGRGEEDEPMSVVDFTKDEYMAIVRLHDDALK